MAQKLKFSIKDFLGKCDRIHRSVDLITFTEEILHEKLHIFEKGYFPIKVNQSVCIALSVQ